MNTDFRIALISDDLYHQGLLKGYCHAHSYELFETAADMESINVMIQMQPNIVILASYPVQGQINKLIREASINHKIPVCYLHNNNASALEEEVTSWVDAVLDASSDINQLDHYLHIRFKHHHRFIQEKRNRARRTANDRRLLMLQQQDASACNRQSANNTSGNGNNRCFMIEPFQIDQRSKCVLFKGKSLNLTRKEFELFELLTQDIDRVFLTDEIINHVWPENNRVTKSDLYQYMHLLRKKIENDPNNPQWILTVKGFGYKLNVPASA
ncbi:MAG TPA: winged helix-turn-helix domain-containing protein [Methylobacter sp.]|jgi:DNA-binding winged helix-turn-helix (wHTH) protein